MLDQVIFVPPGETPLPRDVLGLRSVGHYLVD